MPFRFNVANAGAAILLLVPFWAAPTLAGQFGIEFGALVLASAALIFNCLRRPVASIFDRRWWVCGVCAISLFYFFGFAPDENGNWNVTAYWLIVGIHMASDLCLLSLGTSFAILPAVRTIKTRFLYGWVRHPVYTLYMLADMVFVAIFPSPRNIIVALLGAGSFLVRAELEERILRKRVEYGEYARRIRYRFLPGVY